MHKRQVKSTENRFGSKIKELFELMETNPDWTKYVDPNTKKIVSTLYNNKNMTQTLVDLDMKYTTVRAHIIRAVDRISNKRVDYLRKGRSQLAQRLFELMETPSWDNNLTDQEKLLAVKFKEVKNFYELGRLLDLAPGNIAGTLYGNKQKPGVIGKIEKQIKEKNG